MWDWARRMKSSSSHESQPIIRGIKIPCWIFLNIALTLSNKINSEKNSTQRFSFLRISISSSPRIDLELACRGKKSPTQTTCAMSNWVADEWLLLLPKSSADNFLYDVIRTLSVFKLSRRVYRTLPKTAISAAESLRSWNFHLFSGRHPNPPTLSVRWEWE